MSLRRACRTGLGVLSLLGAAALCEGALAQASQNTDIGSTRHPRAIASFSVGPDQTLSYPADLSTLADQHTTFWPPAAGSNAYLVFASSTRSRGPAGMVVLQTSNLKTFAYAAGYKSPVMVPPIRFLACGAATNGEFDENYAAPGSVVRDPTRPPGHLIMLYEAENHCAGGAWHPPFYATVGLARSTDLGKTWPGPIASALGGANRRPVLRVAAPPPAAFETPPRFRGDVSPSAFVDTDANGKHYLYVTYIYVGEGADGFLRVARARLDDEALDRPGQPLAFTKWYKGAFSQPGIGGLDGGVTPTRVCPGGYQTHGQISYDEAIGQYLLTFVCVSLQGPPGHMQPYQAAWYYSTATSLELQNWITPQLIAGSQLAVTPRCAPDGVNGKSFDGWYPSFMSPGHPDGRLGATGQVFFLKGCDGNGIGRKFLSRTFTIAVAPD